VDRSDKTRLLEAHRPHWSGTWTWLALVAVFVLLEALLFLTLTRGPVWLAVPLVLVLAHVMHGHLLAFHEAAHGSLCPRRFWNEGFGVFIGTFSMMSLSLFRATHHTHHAYLATERDDELWPFVLPGTPRWARRLAAFLELTLGLFYTPLLFLRTFLRKGSPVWDRALRRRIWAELALNTAAWGLILTATAWLDAWPLFLVMHFVPALLAGNMQSWRKYIEHMGLTGSTTLGITRSIVAPGFFGRLVSSSMFNEPYHGVHHRYPRLPQARLPAFTSVLTPSTPEELAPFPTYWDALWPMVRTLGDPRIGAQWRRTAPDGNRVTPARLRNDPPTSREASAPGSLAHGS
jgi:fatty acid desaturase